MHLIRRLNFIAHILAFLLLCYFHYLSAYPRISLCQISVRLYSTEIYRFSYFCFAPPFLSVSANTDSATDLYICCLIFLHSHSVRTISVAISDIKAEHRFNRLSYFCLSRETFSQLLYRLVS